VNFNCGDSCTTGENGGGNNGGNNGFAVGTCPNQYAAECSDEDMNCQRAGYYCYAMEYDAEQACRAGITLCDDFDTSCLANAACTVDNLTDCTASIEVGRICMTRRKEKLTAKKQTQSGAFLYSSGVYMKGTETIKSDAPVYCDHYHLYSF